MKNQFIQKSKVLLPIALLAICCIEVFAKNWIETKGTTATYLTNKHYLGLIGVVLCLIVYIIYRKAYKYVVFVILILGLFNLISFDLYQHSISFSINSLELGPLSKRVLVIALLTIALNFKRTLKTVFGKRTQPTTEVMAALLQQVNAEEKDKFIEKFKLKTTDELQALLLDNRYSVIAKDAAQFILQEREQTN